MPGKLLVNWQFLRTLPQEDTRVLKRDSGHALFVYSALVRVLGEIKLESCKKSGSVALRTA